MTGTLYLVGTPIGNLSDITARAAATLGACDLVAAEDTRETRKLLQHLGLDKPITSYHAHNEQAAGARLIERLLAGEAVALVTDAGMPGISDPGADLARRAIEAGIPVMPIPGPTAFVAALVASGLPTGRFVFEGFLSSSPKLRRRRLRALAREDRTLVFYEAPHRIVDTLTDMAEAWGPERLAAIGRELTKRFEEFRRGTLAELKAGALADPPRGEIVLVVAGAPETDAPAPAEGDWQLALLEALQAGKKPTEAAKEVARAFGLSRQELYDHATRMRQDAPDA